MFLMNLLWRFGVVAIAAVDDIISSSAPLTGVLGAFLSLLPGSGRNRLGEGCCVVVSVWWKWNFCRTQGVCLLTVIILWIFTKTQRGLVDFTGSVLNFSVCVLLLQDDWSSVHQLWQWSECSPLWFCLLFSCCGGNITTNLQQISCRPIWNILKDEW